MSIAEEFESKGDIPGFDGLRRVQRVKFKWCSGAEGWANTRQPNGVLALQPLTAACAPELACASDNDSDNESLLVMDFESPTLRPAA
eukprot:SAG11_NODE_9991_length_864_cov_0.780392_2_plen_86_part_01